MTINKERYVAKEALSMSRDAIKKTGVIAQPCNLKELENKASSRVVSYRDSGDYTFDKQINTNKKEKNTALTINKKSRSDLKQIPVRLSFQLMTRAEPVTMVIATIKSLLAIKAADDEILIVDNNHTKTELYEPLAKFCNSLDAKLKVHFYHVDAVAGFKAGALNLALGLMNPHSTHVVVVDSDYQALPQARDAIVNAIRRYPNHTLLQFPQFYRDAGRVDVHSELNHYFNYHLYRPFNRERALSTGTYAVIRRDALINLGGWSGASITEDAQMGVLMHRQGLRSQFIPEVIATGLLPTSIEDLVSQRRRWIYGNMQVLNTYFTSSSSPNGKSFLPETQSNAERFAYIRAHLSQLSAWVNFTGIFILLHISTLVIVSLAIISLALIAGFNINLSTLLTPLYIVYASYALFLGRRLWAYLHDNAPLNLPINSQQVSSQQMSSEQVNNQQVNNSAKPSLSRRLRAWELHLNFWELGALSWWPVLWGREKPFICTPKQAVIRTQRSVRIANLLALPKLLLILNGLTAIIVSPFSSLYSPLLFVCAVAVFLLKLGAARVIMTNYHYVAPSLVLQDKAANSTGIKGTAIKSKSAKEDKPVKSFTDDNAVNF